MHFWPRLDHAEQAGREVEPDVVWEDETGVLVIEVKWNGLQAPAQVDSECAAAMRKYPRKRVSMLALGGVNSDVVARLRRECIAETLLAIDWERFADFARKMLRDQDLGPSRNVLDDIVVALRAPPPLRDRLGFDRYADSMSVLVMAFARSRHRLD
jgi:hypothetical protein